ncbi:MAG: adenosylcobinamide-GDP ribazoletransferase [Pyrodictiaceae archaeon]
MTVSYVVAAESMYLALALLPKPRHRGLDQMFYSLGVTRRSEILDVLIVTLFLILLAYLSPLQVIVAALASVVATLLAAKDAWRRVGYASGDVPGFIYEVANTTSLPGGALAVNPASW